MLTPAEDAGIQKPVWVSYKAGAWAASRHLQASDTSFGAWAVRLACSLLAAEGSETYRLGRFTLEIKQKDKVTYVISRYQITRNGHSLEITSWRNFILLMALYTRMPTKILLCGSIRQHLWEAIRDQTIHLLLSTFCLFM